MSHKLILLPTVSCLGRRAALPLLPRLALRSHRFADASTSSARSRLSRGVTLALQLLARLDGGKSHRRVADGSIRLGRREVELPVLATHRVEVALVSGDLDVRAADDLVVLGLHVDADDEGVRQLSELHEGLLVLGLVAIPPHLKQVGVDGVLRGELLQLRLQGFGVLERLLDGSVALTSFLNRVRLAEDATVLRESAASQVLVDGELAVLLGVRHADLVDADLVREEQNSPDQPSVALVASGLSRKQLPGLFHIKYFVVFLALYRN